MPRCPRALGPLLHSGLLLASLVAVLLNVVFNWIESLEIAAQESAEASAQSEA